MKLFQKINKLFNKAVNKYEDDTRITWVTPIGSKNRYQPAQCAHDKNQPYLLINGKLSSGPIRLAGEIVNFPYVSENECTESSLNNKQLYSETKKPTFKNAKSAGNYGESLFRDEIIKLREIFMLKYIETDNMIFKSKNFEIDFLILASGIGLILVEVKYYSGDVKCSESDSWIHTKENNQTNKKSASKVSA